MANFSHIWAMFLVVSSVSLVAIAPTQAQPPASVTPACDEHRGQIIEKVARDLIDRGLRHTREGNLRLATQSFQQAAVIGAAISDPFAKADILFQIVNAIALPDQAPVLISSTKEFPKIKPSHFFEESTTQSRPPQKNGTTIFREVPNQHQDMTLDLLQTLVSVVQTLQGEYGVLNVKQSLLTKLANSYVMLGHPDSARPLLDQARQTLEALQGDGFGLIVVPVAEGYLAVEDRTTAIALLNWAQASTQAMATDDPSYRSDIWGAIATTYARAGAQEQALHATTLIPLLDKRVITLAQIAPQFEPALANRLLADVVVLYQSAPRGSIAEIRSQIAIAYTRIGDGTRSRAMAATIASPTLQAQTWARMAEVYAEHNQLHEAIALLPQIRARAATLPSWIESDELLKAIVSDFQAKRQYELAVELIQRLDDGLRQELLLHLIATHPMDDSPMVLQTMAARIPHWLQGLNPITLRHLVSRYARIGQYEQAVQTLQRIDVHTDALDWALAQTAIAHAYTAHGQFEQAIALLDQTLQTLEPQELNPLNAEALSQIVVEYAQAGRNDQAMVLQTRLLAKTGALTYPSPIVEQLINQYLAAEQYDLGLQLIQSLNPQNYYYWAGLSWIGQQLLEVGDYPFALQVANLIPIPAQKANLLITIADYYIGTAHSQAAAAILAQAFAIAQAIEEPQENRLGEFPDEFDQGSLIEAIAIRYAELGQSLQAQQTAQRLQQPAHRDRLRQRLSCYRITH